MSNDLILFEKNDGIATITINRPEVYNALNGASFWALTDYSHECFADDSIRAVILTAAGDKAFCMGGGVDPTDKVENVQMSFSKNTMALARVITDFRKMPKPVIASINGICAGVGLSLVAACDLRICHSQVVFKQAYTSLGINQDGGWTQLMPLLIGLSRASEMVFLDEVVPAEKALQWGLVNKVTAPEELREKTMKYAKQLANGATHAFAISKALLNKSLLPYLETMMEEERQGLLKSALTEDFLEGVRVITRQKAAPEFKGK